MYKGLSIYNLEKSGLSAKNLLNCYSTFRGRGRAALLGEGLDEAAEGRAGTAERRAGTAERRVGAAEGRAGAGRFEE